MYERPIPVSILAIDPGARSGWARFTWVQDAECWLVDAGSCDVWGLEPTNISRSEVDAIVIESPGKGGTGRFLGMAVGLGQAIGIWRREWRLAEGPKSRELDVVQVSWRAGILGGKRETAEWKEAAIEHVQAIAGWHASPWALTLCNPMDGEIAESLCMGWWALHSPLLADLLGPRALAKLGWDDRAMCLEAKASRGKRHD